VGSASPAAPAASGEPASQPESILIDEAHRISKELQTARRVGYLRGPDDPAAWGLAAVIKQFNARVAEF
jgi:hypothetical protein